MYGTVRGIAACEALEYPAPGPPQAPYGILFLLFFGFYQTLRAAFTRSLTYVRVFHQPSWS